MKKIKTTLINSKSYVYNCPKCKRGFKITYKNKNVIKCICGEKILLLYR